MITEDYCFYELSQLLKEKGFEGVCDYAYSNKGNYFEVDRSNFDEIYCLRPTYQIAMKWLREVHKLYITISHRFSHNADQDVCFSYYINVDKGHDGEFMTYEETVEAALKYSLKNLI